MFDEGALEEGGNSFEEADISESDVSVVEVVVGIITSLMKKKIKKKLSYLRFISNPIIYPL